MLIKLSNLFLLGEVVPGETVPFKDQILEFINSVAGGITQNITLADIGVIVASIIALGIVAIFAWQFARKGYNFAKNALMGKGGKI